MKQVTLGLFGLVAVVGGSSLAKGGVFENHLTSPTMVSPAQLYQVQETKTDFSLGYTSATDSKQAKGKSEESFDSSSTNIFAGGIFNIKSIGMRAGLSADFSALDNSSGQKNTTTNGSSVTLTPQFAYGIGPVVLGVAADVVQKSETIEDNKSARTNFTRFKPGILFVADSIETGLTYTSPTRLTPEEADKVKVLEPAKVTAHGRYSFKNDLALGAIVTNNDYKAIDKELFTNQTQVKGTAEYLRGPLKIEADVGYNSSYFSDKNTPTTSFSKDTIATYEVGVAGDYSLNKSASLGAASSYEFGSEKGPTIDVAKNSITLALRGNVKF